MNGLATDDPTRLMPARFTWDELLEAVSPLGKAVTDPSPFSENRVMISTDTRTLAPGAFFLCIRGQRFDGHQYLAQAFSSGAEGALVNRDAWEANRDAWQQFPNLIAVSDTVEAYLALAGFHRRRMPAKIIGLAGSSGKTTTKEMLKAALSPLGQTQCTFKNHNNEIGVSQTLLSLQPETRFMVVEMAMRGPGEIRLLSRYGQPDIGAVINIGPEHIEFFGSLDRIAQAECELFEGLNIESGIAIVNADDTLLYDTAKSLWTGQLETFSLAEADKIEPQPDGGIAFTYQGRYRVRLVVGGRHNVQNALCVLKVSQLLGLSPESLIPGLERFAPVEGRGNRAPLPGYAGAWVINDAYNANPDSMRASVETVLTLPREGNTRCVLVLGPMKELGKLSRPYHEELGQWLGRQTGIAYLYTFDEEGAWIAEAAKTSAGYPLTWFPNREALAVELKQLNWDNTILLLKASRESRLEELIPMLSASAPAV